MSTGRVVHRRAVVCYPLQRPVGQSVLVGISFNGVDYEPVAGVFMFLPTPLVAHITPSVVRLANNFYQSPPFDLSYVLFAIDIAVVESV